MTHPTLICCPYLSLREPPPGTPLTVGPWQIVKSDTFSGSWRDRGFESRVRNLIARMDRPKDLYEDVTLVVSAEHGANGEALSNVELTALQAAIDLGAIGMNAYAGEADAHSLVSSDNTEIQCWPLAESGQVAFDVGGIIKFVSGGWNLNSEKEWSIPYPIETPRPANVQFNSELATSVYDVTMRALTDPGANVLTRSLVTAIRWWSKSWRNSSSITMADRVVFLKTAFEALLVRSRKDKAWRQSLALRCLFENTQNSPDFNGCELEGLLWSPEEQPNNVIRWGNKDRCVTDLQKWYLTFNECRNAIIHEGHTEGSLDYVDNNCAYAGSHVLVAERVFREAVRVCLCNLGYGDLWLTELQKAQRDFAASCLTDDSQGQAASNSSGKGIE